MIEVLLVLAALAVVISIIAIEEDKIRKRNAVKNEYNPFAIDRDGDGLVQEGTKWERPIKSAPKKKAAAKKAAPAKKKAVKKATKKKK